MKGTFITFEGCEGAGKSTQIRLLSQYLAERGKECVVTREPGGSAISEAIRAVILDGKNTAMTDECEALLYAAARAQHLSDTVLPALEEGKTVLCDRYIFSSFAYQGYGRGLDMGFLRAVNSFALQGHMPDITLFLDIPPRSAFERKHGADRGDRMEQLGLAFHRKVYQGYLKLAEAYPDRIAKVDCSGPREQTRQNITDILKERKIID